MKVTARNFEELLHTAQAGARRVEDGTAGFDLARATPVPDHVTHAADAAERARIARETAERNLPDVVRQMGPRDFWNSSVAVVRVQVTQRQAILNGTRQAVLDVPLTPVATERARLPSMPDGHVLARLSWEEVAAMADTGEWRAAFQRAATQLPRPTVDAGAPGLYAGIVRPHVRGHGYLEHMRDPGNDTKLLDAIRHRGLELRAGTVRLDNLDTDLRVQMSLHRGMTYSEYLRGARDQPAVVAGNWGLGDGSIARQGLWKLDPDGPSLATLQRADARLGNVATSRGSSVDLPTTGTVVLPGPPRAAAPTTEW